MLVIGAVIDDARCVIGRSPSSVEATVASRRDAGDLDGAATALVEGYGPELLSFLCATLRNEDEASDAFQTFCEQMWKSLPKYRGESTYRTWAYAIARNSAGRVLRDPRRRSDKRVRLSSIPELATTAEKVRTTTLLHLRTEVKDRVAELCEQLGEEDRAILLLRVNREMTWPEIARVMSDEEIADEVALRRSAAALRQRFQRIKGRLERLVAGDGLLDRH